MYFVLAPAPSLPLAGLAVEQLRKAAGETRLIGNWAFKPELQGRLLEQQVLQGGAGGGNKRKREEPDISPANADQKKRSAVKPDKCALTKGCSTFLNALGINAIYFDPTHGRCYCEGCGAL
jgi:hypothetical protein